MSQSYDYDEAESEENGCSRFSAELIHFNQESEIREFLDILGELIFDQFFDKLPFDQLTNPTLKVPNIPQDCLST